MIVPDRTTRGIFNMLKTALPVIATAVFMICMPYLIAGFFTYSDWFVKVVIKYSPPIDYTKGNPWE